MGSRYLQQAVAFSRVAATITLLALFLWVGASLWVRLSPAQDITLPTSGSYEPFLDDYVVYWVAGRQVLDGEANRLYDLDFIRAAEARAADQPEEEILVLPYYNPPFIAGLMAPLALLPLKASALVFTGLMLVILAVALQLLLRRLENPLDVTLWTAGVLSSVPFFYAVGHGQFSFLLLFIFTVSFFFFKRGSDGFAGATLALLLMKPQLLVLPLLVLVMKRRKAGLLGFSTGAAGLGLASLAIAGPAFLFDYPTLLLNAAGWDDEAGILTWAMFGWNALFRGLVGPESYGTVALFHLGASLATAVLCWYVWRDDWNHESPNFDVRFSVLVFAILLTSPHLYGQDLAIAVLPAVLLYTRWTASKPRIAVAALCLGSWLVLYFHFSILNITGLNFVTLILASALIACSLTLPRRASSTAQDSHTSYLHTQTETLPDVS